MSYTSNSKEITPEAIVISADSPIYINVMSQGPLPLGKLVEIKNSLQDSDSNQLGMIVEANSSSQAIGKSRSFQEALESREIPQINDRDVQYINKVKIQGKIGSLKSGIVNHDHFTITPGTVVETPTEQILEEIFAPTQSSWAHVGKVMHSNTDLKININAISRHVALVGKTGSGKSSSLCSILNAVAEKNGTIVLFDVHGEFKSAKIKNANYLDGKLNPQWLGEDSLAAILGIKANSELQKAVLTQSLTADVKNSVNFLDALMEEINSHDWDKAHKYPAQRVTEMINMLLSRQSRLLVTRGNPFRNLLPNKINIVDLSSLTEKQMDVCIAEYLYKIDFDRRSACGNNPNYHVQFPSPVIVAIEEAHNFIPIEKDTRSKSHIVKISREARKYGLSLIISTQRVRLADNTIVSQVGSIIAHKTTHQDDLHILNTCTEEMTRELEDRIPELSSGEALILGNMVKIPVFAKMDYIKNDFSADFDLVAEWNTNNSKT